MMKNFSLTPAELKEGLTLEDLAIALATERMSPVLFKGDTEPSRVLECRKGYWIMEVDSSGDPRPALDSMKQKIVKTVRETQVARARYCKFHGEEELDREDRPIFTAQLNNEKEVAILKDVFGRASIDSAFGDGGGGIKEIVARLAVATGESTSPYAR
jgi:hypothetical protein